MSYSLISRHSHCATVWSADTLIVLQSDRSTLSLCYSLIGRHSHCPTVWSVNTLIVLQSDRPTLTVLQSGRSTLSLCYSLIDRYSHCVTVWSVDTLISLQSDRPTLSLCNSLIADTLIVLQSDLRKLSLCTVHGTATYRCDNTRGCKIQFWPPDDEHMCSKHVEAWNKLIVEQKVCVSSWLINKIKNIP